MLEDLKRYSTIGDVRGILHFTNIILKENEIKKDSARQLCSFVNDIRINFNGAVSFYEYLGFVTSGLDGLICTTDRGKILHKSIETGNYEKMLCDECMKKIISDEVIDINSVKFDVNSGKYQILKHGFPIAAAVFRNVLIQFHALSELHEGSLELSEQYEELFATVKKKFKRKMSLEALKKKLEKQELQGEVAELYVLNFEIGRISAVTLKGKIKRISIIDVTAGYDIISFEDETSKQYDRFIEVKSFKGKPHFYWSKNEIEIATLYEEKYFLYLVDIERVNDSTYSPLIICNPAKNIIQSDGWLMEPTSHLVFPTDKDFMY